MAIRRTRAKQHATYGISVFIGTGAVAATLIQFGNEESDRVVLWNTCETIPLRDTISHASAQTATATAVREVFRACGSKAQKVLRTYDAKASVKSVEITIAAPWAHTVTRNIRISRSRPFLVTEELLRSLEARVSDDVARELAESELKGESLISCRLASASINGYRAFEPEGARTHDLALTYTIGTCATWLIDAIKDAHGRELASAGLEFATVMETHAHHVARTDTPSAGYLVYIGSEATEIGVMENGVVTHASYTPYGGRSIVRQLATSGTIPIRDAAAWFAADQGRSGSGETGHLDEIATLYETNVIELLERLQGRHASPQVFLWCEEGNAPEFFGTIIERAVAAVHDARPKVVIL